MIGHSGGLSVETCPQTALVIDTLAACLLPNVLLGQHSQLNLEHPGLLLCFLQLLSQLMQLLVGPLQILPALHESLILLLELLDREAEFLLEFLSPLF